MYMYYNYWYTVYIYSKLATQCHAVIHVSKVHASIYQAFAEPYTLRAMIRMNPITPVTKAITEHETDNFLQFLCFANNFLLSSSLLVSASRFLAKMACMYNVISHELVFTSRNASRSFRILYCM